LDEVKTPDAKICFRLNVTAARAKALCVKLHISPDCGIKIGEFIGWKGIRTDKGKDGPLDKNWKESGCGDVLRVVMDNNVEKWKSGVNLYINLSKLNLNGPYFLYKVEKTEMDLASVITGMEEVCEFFEKEHPQEYYSFFVCPCDLKKKNSFYLIVKVDIDLFRKAGIKITAKTRKKWSAIPKKIYRYKRK